MLMTQTFDTLPGSFICPDPVFCFYFADSVINGMIISSSETPPC